MSGNIRDELIRTVIDTKLEPSQNPNVPGFIMGGDVLPTDYIEEIADAIIARFPWITENPRLEHGHTERKSDAPLDPHFAHVYPGPMPETATAWRNVHRYVTPWKETP